MPNQLFGLMDRFYVTRALDVVKMKGFVPCVVEDRLNKYEARIVEVVFDPLRVEEVNDRFRAEGFTFDDSMQVIAVNDDGSILLWGGANSVFHLRKGETIAGAFDETHLAFNDIVDLTARFKIKNKKPEIDELMAALNALGKAS